MKDITATEILERELILEKNINSRLIELIPLSDVVASHAEILKRYQELAKPHE